MGRREYVSSSKTASTLFGKENVSVGEKKLLLALVIWCQGILILWRFGACFPPSTLNEKFSGTDLEDHMGPAEWGDVLTFTWFTQAIEFVGGNVIFSISCHAEIFLSCCRWLSVSDPSLRFTACLLGEQTKGTLGTKKGEHFELLPLNPFTDFEGLSIESWWRAVMYKEQ